MKEEKNDKKLLGCVWHKTVRASYTFANNKPKTQEV